VVYKAQSSQDLQIVDTFFIRYAILVSEKGCHCNSVRFSGMAISLDFGDPHAGARTDAE
jgi:hypothetical protein